jgi:ATP-dependent DNA helicase DinG
VDNLETILGPGGALAVELPGYESRPGQLAMAAAVRSALDERRALLVEAGTGIGKTLGYLVPAALSGKRVVVSTASKALQEQIIGKDIPLLARIIGRPVKAAVLKGVANYVCLRRYSETADADDPDLTRVSEWLPRTLTGDRAELLSVPEEAPVWRLVTTTPDARLGPRCPFFERCFVTNARRAASKADVIIVNHYLYFADATLRAQYPGAAVLPDHDAVVFDEAHALEEAATEYFGVSFSSLRLAALVRDAERDLDTPLVADVHARGDTLLAALRRKLEAVAGRVAAPADLFADGRRAAWFDLDGALEGLVAHATRRADVDEDEAAAAIARRANALRSDLATVAEGDDRKHVRWAEVRGRALFLHASPVDVAPLMRSHIGDTAVFASATLTAAGKFEYIRDRLGLPEDTEAVSIPSPFDFASQSMLYLPRDLPFPDDPTFTEAACTRMAELAEITNGRALFLFTSWRALRLAAAILRPKLPYPVLVQGDSPKTALLDEFRRDIDSVLLATSSFREGVDVPGEALSLVAIDRLPFQPPDDPLAAARAARLEERGEDPFMRLQLPRAAIALKQAFGRLIRKRDDRGIVAILDARIVTRQYGKELLATLPPAGRTSALEQVRRFWKR